MSKSNKTRRAAFAALHRLYRELPTLDCKGLCHGSCGPIPMTELEQLELVEHRGKPLPPMPFVGIGQEMSCPLLTPDKRCSAHVARPLICRLWGMVDHPYMTCPFGCRPSRRLTREESARFLARIQEISDRYFQREEIQ